jgi:hypothetical protein
MDKLTEIKKYNNQDGFANGIDTSGMRYISWLIEQVERYEKALKDISESDEDSSCNELALKYEVIAEKALND